MTTRTKWLAAALLVATAMTTTIGTAVFSDATGQNPDPNRGRGTTRTGGPPAAMLAARTQPQWEYKVASVPLNVLTPEQELNKLGDEGWELVTSGEKGALVFKRQKPRGNAFPPGRGDEGGGTGDGGAPVVEKKADGVMTQVFPIKHTQASSLSATLAPLLTPDDGRNFSGNPFGGGTRLSGRTKLTVDDRTNSLIVIADDATLKMIKELIEKLDVPVKDEPKKPSK